MEKKLNVQEIYECMALLQGFENPETHVKVLGLCNEKGISEGMRRIANKVAKKLAENWPKEQIQDIQSMKEEDNLIKQAKLKELIESEVTMDFEELLDFKILDARLEERKESLTYNYTYLFERLFLNY